MSFQGSDLFAHGGLAQAKLMGGAGEAAQFHNTDQQLERGQAIHGLSFTSAQEVNGWQLSRRPFLIRNGRFVSGIAPRSSCGNAILCFGTAIS
jgi:hypothetical protein